MTDYDAFDLADPQARAIAADLAEERGDDELAAGLRSKYKPLDFSDHDILPRGSAYWYDRTFYPVSGGHKNRPPEDLPSTVFKRLRDAQGVDAYRPITFKIYPDIIAAYRALGEALKARKK